MTCLLGKFRRAFWFIFNYDIPRNKINLTRILSGFITICSLITSLIFIEIPNNILYQKKLFIKKTLITEIFILIFLFIELIIQYFIRPKFQTTTLFLILINFFSLLPIALFLFIWVTTILFSFKTF